MILNLYAALSEIKLKDFPDNAFDSCVTDGPYGIRFMGKAWDKFDIDRKNSQMGSKKKSQGHNHKSMAAGKYNTNSNSNREFQRWTTEISTEVLRVLKPGAHFISFSSPRTFHRLVGGIEDAGFEIRDTLMWIFGSGFPKSHNLSGDWEGWGSALKPAFEPICLARKPLEKGLTIVQNVAKWGTGALNIDACRIPGEPWRYGQQTDMRGGNYNTNRPSNGHIHSINVTGGHDGRWPANIIHDGSEEVVQHFPDAPGQQGSVGPQYGDKKSVNTFGDYGPRNNFDPREDFGSAARFFYVPKTSNADRHEGCNTNFHPTVKPTQLMQYLVTLITPKGGNVLDHFCGSGTTGKACAIEGYNFTGIDMDPENIEISRKRIQYIIDHRDLFGQFQNPRKWFH